MYGESSLRNLSYRARTRRTVEARLARIGTHATKVALNEESWHSMPGPQSKSNPGPSNRTPLVPSWLDEPSPPKLTEDGLSRLLGHRDGIVTALLEVRKQISSIEYRYQHISPRHTRKIAKRDAMLQPLRELESILTTKHQQNQAAYDAQRKQ